MQKNVYALQDVGLISLHKTLGRTKQYKIRIMQLKRMHQQLFTAKFTKQTDT